MMYSETPVRGQMSKVGGRVGRGGRHARETFGATNFGAMSPRGRSSGLTDHVPCKETTEKV